MKKISIYLLALTLVLSGLTACSSRNTATPSPSPAVSTSPDNSILPDTDDGVIDENNAGDDGMIDDNGTDNGGTTNDGGTTNGGGDDIITDDVQQSASPAVRSGSTPAQR